MSRGEIPPGTLYLLIQRIMGAVTKVIQTA